MRTPYVSDRRGLRQRQDGLTWVTLGADVWSFGARSRANTRVNHAMAASSASLTTAWEFLFLSLSLALSMQIKAYKRANMYAHACKRVRMYVTTQVL